MKSPNPLSSVLSRKSRALGQIVDQCGIIRALDAISASHIERLAPGASRHCRCGRLVSGTLFIFCSNQAWATKLRFLTPQLLNALRKEVKRAKIISISIKVAPKVIQEVGRLPVINPATISEQTRLTISEAANSLDGDLGKALERLAKHRR